MSFNNIDQENIDLKQTINNWESKSNTVDNDKQLMEEQINNYRKQIEDFDLQKSQERSTERENISFIQNDDYEQYRLSIHQGDYSELDTLFQHLYSWKNQADDSNTWQINLIKPNDKVTVLQMKIKLVLFSFRALINTFG